MARPDVGKVIGRKTRKRKCPHEITVESKCNSRRESNSLEHRTETTLAPLMEVDRCRDKKRFMRWSINDRHGGRDFDIDVSILLWVACKKTIVVEVLRRDAII